MDINTKQQNLRLELAASIISFKERLLSFAQYNLEEMDDETKSHLFGMIHHSGLCHTPDELLAFTKDGAWQEKHDG